MSVVVMLEHSDRYVDPVRNGLNGDAPMHTCGHKYVERFGELMLLSAASVASRSPSSVSNKWLLNS